MPLIGTQARPGSLGQQIAKIRRKIEGGKNFEHRNRTLNPGECVKKLGKTAKNRPIRGDLGSP